MTIRSHIRNIHAKLEVGDRAELEDLPNVVLHGQIGPEEIPGALATFDVGVMPYAEVEANFAAAAPGLPFYYYHIPSVTGVRLPIAELLESAARAFTRR